MPDHREYELRADPIQIAVNFSPPPVIADCDHHIFRSVSGADVYRRLKPAQDRVGPPSCAGGQRIVKTADDGVSIAQFDRVDYDGRMKGGADYEQAGPLVFSATIYRCHAPWANMLNSTRRECQSVFHPR